MSNYTYLDSSFVSDKYKIFCDLGYPMLDAITFNDGEWCVIELLNAPLIPALTRWQYVLKGMRNIELCEGLVRKFIKQLDPHEPEFWIKEYEESRKVVDLKNKQAEAQEDWSEWMGNALKHNAGLMERVAKYGAKELHPDQIAYRIAEASPATARSMGITVTQEHKVTGAKEKLC